MPMMHLENRSVIRIHGADAAEFLQNTLTNDIRKVNATAPVQYALLLSPQGQVLHEAFIVFQGEGDYLLDTFAPRVQDLMRRLSLFKLRARVDVTPLPDMQVYADSEGNTGMADPRQPSLGTRIYTAMPQSDALGDGAAAYLDHCIALGVASAEAIRFEKDFVHDLGLQNLNAIAWDKGCFIGQEVAARVEHRGLSKKILCMISPDDDGATLPPEGAIITAAGDDAGEMRVTDTAGKRGLAVLKKMALEGNGALFLGETRLRVL